MSRVYSVYEGRNASNKLVYIGTTMQKPKDRFRWHKANGKDLKFKVLFEFDNADEMLDKEFELIKLHKPKLNKITKRRQNDNRRLTPEALAARKGDKQWCQSCLKRRVNKGYKKCMFC